MRSQVHLSHPWLLAATTALASACLPLLSGGCAPQLVTYDQQLFMEADSLFKAGRYETARQRFERVRATNPNSRLAARAQYNLGYLNVYYDNPAANWETALKEFKTFTVNYPNSDLLPEVNTWIRLLVVLQAFKREYNLSTSEIKELQNRMQSAPAATRTAAPPNYDLLLESVSRCYADRDSLVKKIKVLEEVIQIFEKKR